MLYDKVARLRDRVVMAPAFHRLVQALPFTRPVAVSQTKATFNVVAGFVYSQTLAALVSLNLFDRLGKAPASTATLAQELELPERSVEVLMRAAHALGFVDRRKSGWGLGLKGAAMLGQGGIAEMVAHHAHFYADLADPVGLLRGTKSTALSSYWTYAGNEADGDPAPYTALMAASQDFVAHAVLHNRVFGQLKHLVDLGGGAGAFAAAALKCHPNLTVTVADRPDVIPFAVDALAKAGLAARSNTAAIDFFTSRLAFDADAISLVRILHDHDDAPVAALLKKLATESPNARLLVIEPMADLRRPSGFDAYFPWYFKAMQQGRYRTFDELSALLKRAGYTRIRRLKSRNPTLVRALCATVHSD